MYSKFPKVVYDEKEQFYSKLIEKTKRKSYEYYLNALKGIFSGTIINYFNKNKQSFDIVSVHGGLVPFTIEISPFSDFPEFNVKVDTLSQLRDLIPDNESLNIIYDLSKEILKIKKMESDYFLYATYLSKYLSVNEMVRKKDFSTLNYWLVNVDTSLNLTNISITKEIWKNKKEGTIKDMSLIFLSCFIAEKECMTAFITENRHYIFNYLITETDSLEIKEVNNGKDIVVKYILLPTDYDDANNESVKRLRLICEMLPIYDHYHSEAIRPKINFIEMLQLHDDSIKKIPQKSLVIMFHQFFNKIWLNTIQSNYESNTVYDWAMFWSSIRERIAALLKKMIEFTELKVTNKKLSVKSSEKFLDTANSVLKDLKKNFFYPGEYHPFRENDDNAPQEYKFRKEYFTNMQVVIEHFANFLLNPDKEKLWTFNLKKAAEELSNMQLDFKNIILAKEIGMENLDNLEMVESELIEDLILTGSYFQENMSVKFISQAIIKKWYENQHSSRIKEIKKSIESNGIEQIKFIYPKQIIEKNSLVYLPLVLIDSDILNDEYNGILLYALTSLCEFQIDFIDILYLEVNGSSLNKRMMRINNTFLQKLKQAILTDDMSEVEYLTPALPLEVDKSYLNLYDFKFRIEMENGVYPDYDIIECEKLMLLLWKYSFIKNSNSEIKYGLEKHFDNQEEMLLIKIKGILIQMKNDNSTLLKLGEKTYDEIVKNDSMFLDADLDNFYEYVGRMNLTDAN
ncbi:hypothetical protein FM106_13960 [Brachybacterium faecium]|nr:hypothetical protein FM106_13960 [Brachybacterium faecium]